MEKQRASRNQTLTVHADEEASLRQRLFIPDKQLNVSEITDCTIMADLLPALDLLPRQFADLIIIDPPYNLTRDFAGNRFKEMSDSKYIDYLNSWFPRVVDCLKPNGSLYLCGDWKCTAALQTVMQQHLTILNRITWQREKGKGALSNWKNSMEDIWFGVKNPKNYTFNVEAVKLKRKVIAPYRQEGQPKDWQQTDDGKFRLTYPSNFWNDITVPFWSMPENTDHPTQKPEKLIAKLLLASSNEGDLVFDPFLGSGTTSVVARKLNRRFCGVEMNETYCLLAEKRLKAALTDTTIQGYSDGVFWERNAKIFSHKDAEIQGELFHFSEN
jgi:site-specific DNA-methyltransferase (adenine-specific)